MDRNRWIDWTFAKHYYDKKLKEDEMGETYRS